VTKEKRPGLSWSDERKGFIIYLPKTQLPYPGELQSILRDATINCFNKVAAAPVPLAQRTAATSADDWADVSVDTKTGKAAVVEPISRSIQPGAQQASDASFRPPEVLSLPDLGMLARPDELLMKPPYHMVVYNKGNSLVEVQASHSPSLQLMAEYLKKWSRLNHQDVRTVSALSPSFLPRKLSRHFVLTPYSHQESRSSSTRQPLGWALFTTD
jgi:hypothetical protein